jgi:predicted RNA-binding Zn-ribbon protein involved in translation (DUF1610 family)
MKVLQEYPNSHHYVREYQLSGLFCPTCGKQEVWAEQGGGDYYLGVDYVCASCGSTANLDSVCVAIERHPDLGILEQLKTGVTKVATTPRGR